MKIGVDFDGVIIDTERNLKFWADYYSYFKLNGMTRKTGRYTAQEKCFDWNDEQIKTFYKKYYIVASKNAPFLPGVKEVCEQLKKQGHEIYVITARESNNGQFDETIYAKRRIKELGFEFDGIYFDVFNKPEKCRELGIDIMVDDGPQNVEMFAGTEILTLYFKDVQIQNITAPNIKKIDTWMDIYLEVQKQMKKK